VFHPAASAFIKAERHRRMNNALVQTKSVLCVLRASVVKTLLAVS